MPQPDTVTGAESGQVIIHIRRHIRSKAAGERAGRTASSGRTPSRTHRGAATQAGHSWRHHHYVPAAIQPGRHAHIPLRREFPRPPPRCGTTDSQMPRLTAGGGGVAPILTPDFRCAQSPCPLRARPQHLTAPPRSCLPLARLHSSRGHTYFPHRDLRNSTPGPFRAVFAQRPRRAANWGKARGPGFPVRSPRGNLRRTEPTPGLTTAGCRTGRSAGTARDRGAAARRPHRHGPPSPSCSLPRAATGWVRHAPGCRTRRTVMSAPAARPGWDVI